MLVTLIQHKYYAVPINPVGFFSTSPLGVILDFLSRFHLNTLQNGIVLFLFLGQKPLDPESLMRRHGKEWSQPSFFAPYSSDCSCESFCDSFGFLLSF